jgi:soluble lytic murein transglycosylase-like protein
MVASAYHAGASNVKIWALNYGADQKTITMDQIPKDNTRDYVEKVMNAYALFYEYDVSH